MLYVRTRHSHQTWRSTECTRVYGTRNGVVVARDHASGWSRACSNSWVAAQHGDARAIFRTAERDHVLANMASDDLTVLYAAVGQDVLDEVISKLIASNCKKISIGPNTAQGGYYVLSIKGMRGRSGRPSQTRSRYRSRNSALPIFKHFSMTLEAY